LQVWWAAAARAERTKQRAAHVVDHDRAVRCSFLRVLRLAQPLVVVDHPPFVRYSSLQAWNHARPVVVTPPLDLCMWICVSACHLKRAAVRMPGARSPHCRSIQLVVLLKESWLLAEQLTLVVWEQGSIHTPDAVCDVQMVCWIHHGTSSGSSDDCCAWVRQ
jgi:hypothetical protein